MMVYDHYNLNDETKMHIYFLNLMNRKDLEEIDGVDIHNNNHVFNDHEENFKEIQMKKEKKKKKRKRLKIFN